MSPATLKLNVKKTNQWIPPEHAFVHLVGHHPDAVWLDSSRLIEGFSRFSFMGNGAGPLSYKVSYDVTKNQTTVKNHTSTRHYPQTIFDFLTEQLANPLPHDPNLPFAFIGGLVGYFGYELNQLTTTMSARHASEHPDAQFLFLDRVLVFDHLLHETYLVALSNLATRHETMSWFKKMEQQLNHCITQPLPSLKQPSVSVPYTLSQNQATYLANIDQIHEYLRHGESYEMCLTNRLTYLDHIDPLAYHRLLRQHNPAPYGAFLRFDQLAIASSSIERYLHIDTDRTIEAKPMKGTLPRGATPSEDTALKQRLVSKAQFQSEMLMIVDLLRNDLSRVCEPGSVHVPELMFAESYATVHQLVSIVRGRLRQTCSVIDAIMASFPGGSMTGAPKRRSMCLLQELEPHARGIYSGALGYLSLNGAVDLSMVIRTAIITPEKLCIGVGGAIITLSDPEEEYNEMLLKSKALRDIIHVFKT